MALVASMFGDSVNSMESRKRKGVPLPYLIRPRRVFTFDTFEYYNDYPEYSANLAEEESSSETVDKSTCFGGKCFGLGDESSESLSEIVSGPSVDYESSADSVKYETDEEYVIVDSFKPERVGAIQMMDLSKDVPVSPAASEEVSQNGTGEESESEVEGSNNDESESEGEGSNNVEAESEGEGSNSDGWEFV